MAFPDIKLGSTFDAKGFKQAETATKKLERNVKSLAATFGIAFGARAVVNFGKSAAKAFIEDDNAARSLGITIKNLGLNYDNNAVIVGRFIDSMEKQTGVLDDELRPAMDRLLRATGSVSKSQELLNLSLDIAAGTGKTVTQVSQSLQKAYLGQTAAVGRLGVGLSKAELATGKFSDIQEKLTTLFAGQALSAAESYAGQLNKLQVSANNAKETIGEGLIDALTLLGEDNNIDSLNSALEDTSLYIADVIRGIGALGDKIKGIPLLGKAFSLPLDAYVQAIPVIGGYISILANMGSELRTLNARAGRAYTGGSGTSRDFVVERQIKADKAAADRKIKLDKLTAAAKAKADKLAETKRKKSEAAAAALSKAAAVFDLNKIQIAAALKQTYDKDERLRLLAMQEIENENGEAALKYIEQLNLLTKEQQTNKLAGIKTISDTELNYINQLLLDELQRIKTTKMSEAEAAAARATAYAQYNAAIAASGGLALANFYSEKTQIELLTIAKLASLDTVAAAQATMDILNYTSQDDIITRVAAAQKLADDAKQKALDDYLKGYDAGIAAIAASQTLTDAEKLAALTTYLTQASDAITALGGSQKTIDDAKMAALKLFIQEATKPLTQTITLEYITKGGASSALVGGSTQAEIDAAVKLATDAAEAATKLAAELAAESAGNVTTNNGAPKFGIGGQPLGDNGYSAGYGMGFNSTASTGTIDNSLTINIEGMIDSGSFDEVVNQSLLNNIRRGYSQFPAGAIATP